MAKTRAELFEFLDAQGLAHQTVEHRPIFTVEEGRGLKASMPGGHSKNLFLKDKKGRFFLAVAHCDTEVDIVGYGRVAGAKGRLSFARPEQMTEMLGVAPGSVTPFALINDTARALTEVAVDRALFNWSAVWFHPLENNASTTVSPADLLRFIRACGHEPRIVDLARPESDGAN
ncbi:MAG: prolyl-tRNA synthetase associated domain-containing protein [Pseudomonadota bacterium]